jgi:hypothetical protein
MTTEQTFRTVTVKEFHIAPGLEEVLTRPLWGGPASHSRGFVQRSRRMLEFVEQENLIHGRVIMAAFRVTRTDTSGIELENAGKLSVNLTASAMSRCTDAVLALATIGPHCETRAAFLNAKGERLKGLLLDVIGSIGMQNLLNQTRRAITEIASREGLNVGLILSPGTKRLPVDQQVRFHEILQADRIGIQTTPSGMLWPVKSGSMLVTLGGHMPDCGETHACSDCDSYDVCQLRHFHGT